MTHGPKPDGAGDTPSGGDGAARYVVDRFEGDLAVVEGLGTLPAALLPAGAREGDVLIVSAVESTVTLRLDRDGRAAAEAETRRLQATLLRLDIPEGGSVDL